GVTFHGRTGRHVQPRSRPPSSVRGHSVEEWAQALAQSGFPPLLVEHLSQVAETHKHGEQDIVTDVVETVGGTPPKSLETFVRENRTAFEPAIPARSQGT
ncbi:MAG: hypothetical protein J2P23_10925, partial [Microlunatus sp.]|nr:hypothetical protein [Microlunatus sp.]